jgi:putative ABC transport system permease protein
MRMTFRQFAFNNVLRNKRTYAAYFFSSAFSVMVFFVYAVFAFHPGLSGGSLNIHVAQGMFVAEAIIYVFSFFFVLYSMGAFLKTRKKEFGLMMMHGMTDLQLRLMVFIENMLIGFFAAVAGIGAGLVLEKLILLLAENLLQLEETLPFYLPIMAMLLTFAAFMVLFMVISLFTVVMLRSSGLIELLKSSDKPKPEPKSSSFLSALAVVLLAAGYGIALAVRGLMVVTALIPVTVIVIIGTYFLFTQLSVFLVRLGKGKRSLFWSRTNLLLFSDLAYRMKDNARIFFIVAILSTVAFCAIGSLVGFKSMYVGILTSENPFAFQYHSEPDNARETEEQHVRRIREVLDEEGVVYEHLVGEIKQAALAGSDKTVKVIGVSQYNAFAEAAGEETVALADNEAVMLYYSNALNQNEPAADPHLQLDETAVQLDVVKSRSSYLFPVFGRMYVLPDSAFAALSEAAPTERIHVFHTEEWKGTTIAGRRLSEELPSARSYNFFSLAYALHGLNQAFGAILFVGLFIGAVFFVAAGSFLYFRLYTDLEGDKRKFAAISKLGLTEGEMSGIVTKQLAILFLAPIGVAAVHGAVALTALQHMFSYNLFKESAAVLGTFVIIQLLYFLMIRSRYIRQVKGN